MQDYAYLLKQFGEQFWGMFKPGFIDGLPQVNRGLGIPAGLTVCGSTSFLQRPYLCILSYLGFASLPKRAGVRVCSRGASF